MDINGDRPYSTSVANSTVRKVICVVRGEELVTAGVFADGPRHCLPWKQHTALSTVVYCFACKCWV